MTSITQMATIATGKDKEFSTSTLIGLPCSERVNKLRKRRILGMGPFRYRILIVDDDNIIAEMAKAILESQGYEVHCAIDGFGASPR